MSGLAKATVDKPPWLDDETDMTPRNLLTDEPITTFGPPPPPPPSLQHMVVYFGGYDKIPEDVWAGYDEAMADWMARYSWKRI